MSHEEQADLPPPSNNAVAGEILSVVVPCYNEEAGLDALLTRLRPAVEKTFSYRYEIILVDDGSKDETWALIEASAKAHPQTIGIKLSRNHGHQLALSSGLAYAKGDLVFVLDADLQDPPELLAGMLDLLRREQADVVYGKRTSRDGETWFKKITASLFYKFLAQNTEVNFPTDAGDFRLMTGRVAKILAMMPERDRFVRGMVAWIGLKQVAYDYHREARVAGKTNYPLKKMISLAKQAFMGFSMLPLKFAGQFAVLMFALMISIMLYALGSWIFFDTVSGWTSLMILFAFVSGVQLLILSVLGEYIGRTYLASKERPLYIVDRVEGGDLERLHKADERAPFIQHKGIWL